MKRATVLSPSLAAVIACAAVLCLASGAQAATPHFGVFGGIGIAKMRTDATPFIEFESFKAPAFGATVRFEMSPTFSIEPGVMYVSDGFSLGESETTDEFGNPKGTIEALSVLEHVQVPVLFRYTLPSSGKPHVFGFAGPYASIHASEYLRVTGAVEEKLERNGFRSAHAGVIVGAGMQMATGPGQIELQLRYDAGLTPLQDSGSSGNIYANAVRVLLGWSH